jgi:hypothetical protein
MARLLGVGPETIRRWEAGGEAEGPARLLLAAFDAALDVGSPGVARVQKLLQTSSDLGLSYLLLHLLNAYARAPTAPGPETPA